MMYIITISHHRQEILGRRDDEGGDTVLGDSKFSRERMETLPRVAPGVGAGSEATAATRASKVPSPKAAVILPSLTDTQQGHCNASSGLNTPTTRRLDKKRSCKTKQGKVVAKTPDGEAVVVADVGKDEDAEDDSSSVSSYSSYGSDSDGSLSDSQSPRTTMKKELSKKVISATATNVTNDIICAVTTSIKTGTRRTLPFNCFHEVIFLAGALQG
jgi:hypothetical protein